MPLVAGRKRKGPRKRRGARKVTTKNFKSKVKTVIKSVAEPKFFRISNLSSQSSVGIIRHITPIPQDSTVNGRDGEYIWGSYVYGKFTVIGVDSTNFVRIMIFADISSGGVAPTVANVMETDAVNGMINNVNRRKFRILADKVVSTTLGGNNARYFTIFKRFRRKLSYFGATTDPRLNHLFIYTVSDSILSTHPIIDFDIRFRYTDT